MRIEELTSNTDEVFAGIAELQNENHLAPDNLIKIAIEMAKDALAIQFLNPHHLAGELHLLAAAQNAWNAWSGSYSIARFLDVEIILYASAQKQIKNAFAAMGLEAGLGSVAVVVIAESEDSIKDILRRMEQRVGASLDEPFSVDRERLERIQLFFEIPDIELDAISESSALEDRWEALVRCVVSRVALVATEA